MLSFNRKKGFTMRRHSLRIGILAIGLLAGVATAQAGIETYGNNKIDGNGSGNSPTGAPIGMK